MNAIQSDQHLEPWVEEYRTRGYVKLPGVFSSQEMDAVRDDFDRLFEATDRPLNRWMPRVDVLDKDDALFVRTDDKLFCFKK